MRQVQRLALWSIAACMLGIAACNSPGPEVPEPWPVDMEHLLRLHCDARDLQKARFALADSIRQVEDSLLATPESDAQLKLILQSRIDAYGPRKDVLAKESRDLADSIRRVLNDVIVALDPDAKRAFNDSLQRMVLRAGCE